MYVFMHVRAHTHTHTAIHALFSLSLYNESYFELPNEITKSKWSTHGENKKET